MLNPITRLFACSTLIWNASLIASTVRVPTNLTCTPATVDSGSSATCTVTISKAAPVRGSHVQLSRNRLLTRAAQKHRYVFAGTYRAATVRERRHRAFFDKLIGSGKEKT